MRPGFYSWGFPVTKKLPVILLGKTCRKWAMIVELPQVICFAVAISCLNQTRNKI